MVDRDGLTNPPSETESQRPKQASGGSYADFRPAIRLGVVGLAVLSRDALQALYMASQYPERLLNQGDQRLLVVALDDQLHVA